MDASPAPRPGPTRAHRVARSLAGFLASLALVAPGAAALLGAPAAPAAPTPAGGPNPDLAPRWRQVDRVWTVELVQDGETVAEADPVAPSGLEIRLPDDPDFRPVHFRERRPLAGEGARGFELGPTSVGSLVVRLEEEPVGPALLRRTLVVSSAVPARFAARLSVRAAGTDGTFASFDREETGPIRYDTLGGGPEFPDTPGQTFPVATLRRSGRVLGLIADSPGRWENLCQVELDPATRRLAVLTGDGKAAHEMRIRYDARDTYTCTIDGWHDIAAGETRRFDTWVFTSRAETQYDTQLAAHIALANARGWNHSTVEAILRNTAYLLVRRNLMREGRGEGRYIFTSGIGYGWKQWVSDGFWQAVALEDPELLVESHRSVFVNRMTYEDNAQYYLIWAALVKRAGTNPDAQLVHAAYDFIRNHETNGVYVPPGGLNPERPKGFKSYHDLLEYEDGDAPVSNQGFHCGALMAARELGMPVADGDIRRATKAYARMFHFPGGYFPTSVQQPQHVGQDTLYGAALTYAVFGEKILPDDAVQTHWQTSQKLATPYGLRVISTADGNLLPGHSGEYVFGGSWFLNDAANHLMALLHGIPRGEVEMALVRRLTTEVATVPAFHESISTLTGKPHGHILYSWNSGYWWLRRKFRERLGQTGPDPVELALDVRLGVTRDAHGLRLQPKSPAPRPGP